MDLKRKGWSPTICVKSLLLSPSNTWDSPSQREMLRGRLDEDTISVVTGLFPFVWDGEDNLRVQAQGDSS
jgi:hypothetical protein